MWLSADNATGEMEREGERERTEQARIRRAKTCVALPLADFDVDKGRSS